MNRKLINRIFVTNLCADNFKSKLSVSKDSFLKHTKTALSVFTVFGIGLLFNQGVFAQGPIFTGDAGNLSNIIREGMRTAAKVREEGAEPAFAVVGRKGVSAMTFRKQDVTSSYVGFTDRPAFANAREIGEEMTARYVDEDLDRDPLGMGRDIPDGNMRLRDGYLELDWTTKTSRAYFDGVKSAMEDLAGALGARFTSSPLWYFRRVITVHPLGGAPMGRSPERRRSWKARMRPTRARSSSRAAMRAAAMRR